MADSEGAPVWFELTTSDQDKAQDFYQAVVGWQIAPSPMPEHGGYRVANAGNESIAGLMTPPPGMDGVSGWRLYFGTSDVDAMAARVQEIGGKLFFGPMDIPHVGRFAVVADPQGVVFNIMTGASSQPSSAFRQMGDSAGHGVWIELATPEPEAALDFYGRLFGWSRQGAMPMGPMGDYVFIGAGEDARPGAVMSSKTTGAKEGWSWYVNVPDIDAAVAAAQGRGGTLLRGPDQIPGGSYSAKLEDAQGFGIGLAGPRLAAA